MLKALTGTSSTKIGEDLRSPHWAQQDRAKVSLFWEEKEGLLLLPCYLNREIVSARARSIMSSFGRTYYLREMIVTIQPIKV